MPARLVVLGVCLFALLVPSAAAPADNPVLEAFVGANDAFSIRLQDASGARVTHLDAGTYTINVHDLSTFHNFHLSGPGVDQLTSVDDKQEVTWTVTLTDGTYTYVCDAHASTMKGRSARSQLHTDHHTSEPARPGSFFRRRSHTNGTRRKPRK